MAKTDEQCMQAYQAGDSEAFEVLYLRASPKLYAYLKKKLGVPSEVEDVFQLVFLKLHKTRFQFDPKYFFDQWLFVIARSVMLDYLKQKKRYETHIINEDPSEIADTLSQTDHPQSYTRVEMPDVSGLSKEQKEVLMLKVMDELTYREIAEKLKRTEVGVRQIFSRAIKKLKMMRKEEAK